LCPKNSSSKYSASFLISGDTVGRIRYWDLLKNSARRKHFYRANNEKIVYRKSEVEKVHIIKDKIETQEYEEAFPKKQFEDFGLDELDEEDRNDNSFPEWAHSSSITALQMLYHTAQNG